MGDCGRRPACHAAHTPEGDSPDAASPEQEAPAEPPHTPQASAWQDAPGPPSASSETSRPKTFSQASPALPPSQMRLVDFNDNPLTRPLVIQILNPANPVNPINPAANHLSHLSPERRHERTLV